MFGFAIAKQYCAAKLLIKKLPNLQWPFKVCSKCNSSIIKNNVSYRCASTEVGAHGYTNRLTNAGTKARPLLNARNPHQKVSIRRYNDEINLDMKTNVITDVLLYRYETKIFSIVAFFAMGYICFWIFCITYYGYLKMKDLSNETFSNFFGNLDIMVLTDVFMICSGPLIYFCSWMFLSRSIKYVILRKGGKHVTVVNYNSFKNIITVPTSQVHCRMATTTQIPTGLNIKGYRGYFMFDSSAEFLNRDLFFNTIAQVKL